MAPNSLPPSLRGARSRLRRLLVNGSTHLGRQLRRYLVHAMSGLGMFSTFLQHLLLGFSPGFEITIHADFPASDDLGHRTSGRNYIANGVVVGPVESLNQQPGKALVTINAAF